MNEVIEAIPTTYKGTQFKSRLEARFGEWLDKREIAWHYETRYPIVADHRPDFYLHCFGCKVLWAEVKPVQFLSEMSMFREDIEKCINAPWICVDQDGRSSWRIIDANAAFWAGINSPNGFHVDLPCRFEMEKIVLKDCDGNNCIFNKVTLFPEAIWTLGDLRYLGFE